MTPPANAYNESKVENTLSAIEDMILANRGQLHGGMFQALYAEASVHKDVVQHLGGVKNLAERNSERFRVVHGAPGNVRIAENRQRELMAVQAHQVQALVLERGAKEAMATIIEECLEWCGGSFAVSDLHMQVGQRKPQAAELFRTHLANPAAVEAIIEKSSGRFEMLQMNRIGKEHIGLKRPVIIGKALAACRELILGNGGFVAEGEFEQKLGLRHRLLVRNLVARLGGLRSFACRYPQQLLWYEQGSPDQPRGLALPLTGPCAFSGEAAHASYQAMLVQVMLELLDKKGGCILAGDIKRHLRAQRTWQATCLSKATALEGSLASFVRSHPEHFEWRCISDGKACYYVCAVRPDPPIPNFNQMRFSRSVA